MSRRDLIIISALINAGLLIVLFATALKPDGVSEPISRAPIEMPVPRAEKKDMKEAVVAAGDEVDQVLKEFAARAMPEKISPPQDMTQREVAVTPSFAPIATTSAHEVPKKSPPSFVEELAAQYPAQITLPEPAKKRETQPAGEYAEVRVQKGDFLDRIARRNKTTVSEIMRVNHLTTTNLKIGQILKVPRSISTLQKSAPVSTTSQEGYCVVQEGDNPWTIAKRHQISVSELLRINQLDDRSARRIKPGDRLRIR